MKPHRPITFTPRRAAIIAGIVAVLMIVGYSGYAALPFLSGPYLKASAKALDQTASIQGTAKRVSFLEVNGAAVPLKEDGSFFIERAFPPGYTAVTITARDRFGREVVTSIPLFIRNDQIHGSEEESEGS